MRIEDRLRKVMCRKKMRKLTSVKGNYGKNRECG
jgi:hypothetical protein